MTPSRSKKLDGLSDWLAERFRRHRGNADVIRQELAQEKDIHVSLRTVERTVAPLRRELAAEARATVRFETPPGEQLQIDFGERRVEIAGVATKVFFFVATLGYSRRLHVRAFGHEKQESWFAGMESRFQAFGGIVRGAARTTPARSSCTMIHRAGRSFFIPGCMPSRSIGVFASGPVRCNEHARRARTSAGSAM